MINKIDFAAGADIVARVKLRLRGETAAIHADFLLRVEHDPHRFRSRIEFNQEGVVAVFRRADVDAPVQPLHDREVAALFARGFRGKRVSARPDPLPGDR